MSRDMTLDSAETPLERQSPAPNAAEDNAVSAAAEAPAARPDEQDDYAAIRAATLAMSGREADRGAAADDTPPPLSPEALPADADAGAAVPQPTARENAPDPDAAQDASAPHITDDSPDVLAAQAGDAPPQPDAPAPTDDGLPAPSGQTPPAVAEAAVPAVGGDGGLPPDTPAAREETPAPDEKPMGLLDHLNEMRWRLVRCLIAAAVGFCVCWAFVEPIFAVIVKPLLAVLPVDGNAMYSTMPEAFFIRMFVACIAGLFLASPVIFYQIWAFISPGLYEEEKLFIVPVAVISAVFFVGGALFCYYIVFPFAFQFFMSYNTEQIRVIPRISDYVDFVLKLLIAFGLIFEMPLFAFFLSRMGVLTAAMMRQARRYAILGIFIVAAILTPPDVVSQLLMALPMLVLYEISVLVAAVFGKKKKKAEPDADASNAGDAPETDAPTDESPAATAARNAEGQ